MLKIESNFNQLRVHMLIESLISFPVSLIFLNLRNSI